METIERIKIERKGDREERPLLAGWYITDYLYSFCCLMQFKVWFVCRVLCACVAGPLRGAEP